MPGPVKPERPLKPAVWWAVGLNALWAVGWLLTMVLLGAFLLYVVGIVSPDAIATPLNPSESGMLVGLLAAAFIGNMVIGIALTIGALLLLRIGRGFRTFPPFVQALLAGLSALAVSSLIGTAFGAIVDLGSYAPGSYGF